MRSRLLRPRPPDFGVDLDGYVRFGFVEHGVHPVAHTPDKQLFSAFGVRLVALDDDLVVHEEDRPETLDLPPMLVEQGHRQLRAVTPVPCTGALNHSITLLKTLRRLPAKVRVAASSSRLVSLGV